MSTDNIFNELANGDLVLRTQSGTRFRIPSTVLIRASAFFAGLLKDAHPDAASGPAAPNEIAVDEDDLTITALLKVATGLPFSFIGLKDMDEIERITHAADKYSMPAVLTIMEVMMHAPLARKQPLRRYALAARYGWTAICADAEKELLDEEIDFTNLPPMDMLHLSRLLRLRQLRIVALQKILDDPAGQFSKGNNGQCTIGHVLSRPTGWESLKSSVLWEMTRRPSGSTVAALFRSYSGPTITKCMDCALKGINTELWTWEYTCNSILKTIETLPASLN